jgi:hypothetical protein
MKVEVTMRGVSLEIQQTQKKSRGTDTELFGVNLQIQHYQGLKWELDAD